MFPESQNAPLPTFSRDFYIGASNPIRARIFSRQNAALVTGNAP